MNASLGVRVRASRPGFPMIGRFPARFSNHWKLLAVLLAATTAFAQLPELINYQGRLVNGTNLVNATTSVVFRLYDAEALGNEVYVETQTVAVVDGLYSVSIGASPNHGTLAEAVTNDIRSGGNIAAGGAFLGDGSGLTNLTAKATTNHVLRVGDTMSGHLTNLQTITAYEFFNSQNDAGTNHSIAHGGRSNIVKASVLCSVIGGGMRNEVGSMSRYATVGGGFDNHVGTNVDYAVILGGRSNTVADNAVGGCAGGNRARANHSGCFVWADFQEADFASTASNQVAFRCQGGVFFASGIGGANQEVSWTPGSASWTFSSDRNMKEGFAPVDADGVLEKVARLPLLEWNYKGYLQRHIGPMAQDFHAAFPFNDSETTLNSADLDGVALAAIQGLNQKLERENERLRARLAEVEKRLEKLSKAASP